MGYQKRHLFPQRISQSALCGMYIPHHHLFISSLMKQKTLHISLVEFKLSKPQTYPFHHVMHCLDALRVEIICHADDTPRYTTTTHDTLSGVGQDRKCRDLGKLERWSLENDACYHYFNHSFNEVIDQRQRYVFCEPGSPYAATVEKYPGQITGL